MDIKSSIALSSHVASAGIGLAITGTRFGLGIARAVTGTLATATGTVLDHTLSLTTPQQPFTSGPASTLLASLTSKGWDAIDFLAVTPLLLTQSFTATSLAAAASTAHALFGSSTESDFSLGAFVTLVQREVADEEQRERAPKDLKYTFIGVLKALGAWAALQGVTSKWADERMVGGMREIDVEREWVGQNQDPLDGETRVGSSHKPAAKGDEDEIHITSTEEIHGANGALDSTIVSAELGHPSDAPTLRPAPTAAVPYPALAVEPPSLDDPSEFKTNVLRYSKICLGSYGGAGMLFFGVPFSKPPPTPADASATAAVASEEAFVDAVEKMNEEDVGTAEGGAAKQEATVEGAAAVPSDGKPAKPGFWATVLGKHDQHIFEHFADLSPADTSLPSSIPHASAAPDPTSAPPPTAPQISIAALQAHGGLPRFWILTDHTRRTIVLALRGTMSLNELAIDLTCDASSFTPYTSSTSSPPKAYSVHSGMLKLAQSMGREGGKVHGAVKAALEGNEGYGLVVTGHSLGAGVGGLLGLLWADVEKCETRVGSGLPAGRKVKVWAYACPCITSSALSHLSRNLITSIILSYDLVSRLSLGSIRDLRAVSDWLSHTLSARPEDGGVEGLLGRMGRYKLGGKGKWIDLDKRVEEEEFFLALRKTLSAQMQAHHLFPAGTTYLLLRPTDLHPETLATSPPTRNEDRTTRVFHVERPEQVFSEIVFDGAMLSCHLPQKYAAALGELF